MSGVTLEDLAHEVAAARGDARMVRNAYLGTDTHPGIRDRQGALEARQDAEERANEQRQIAIERWLKNIDQRQATCEGLLLRMPSNIVLGTFLVCALVVAASAMFVARDTASVARDTGALVKIAIEQRAEQIADERAEQRERASKGDR